MSELLFQQEGYELIGAVIEVHQVLGGGMAEEIYQEALEIELFARKIPFATKSPVAAMYKGTLLSKQYFPDLIVHHEIILELKAVSKLLPEHDAQLLNYLRITGKRVGYLVNFAPVERVEWKRFLV